MLVNTIFTSDKIFRKSLSYFREKICNLHSKESCDSCVFHAVVFEFPDMLLLEELRLTFHDEQPATVRKHAIQPADRHVARFRTLAFSAGFHTNPQIK